MAKQIWKNSKLYLGGYNLSGAANEMGIKFGAKAVPATTYGSGGYEEKMAGIPDWSVDGKGLFDGEPVDHALFDKVGLAGEIATLFGISGAEGEAGFTGQVVEGSYNPAGKVGDAFGFTVGIEGSGSLVRGSSMLSAVKTSTFTGTAFQLGAVSATQRVYAAFHVLAVAGTLPTLVLKLQSDDAQGFASPTDRITFASVNALGAWWATPVAGAIADTWWRVIGTIAGTNPSFTIATIAGIQ